MRHIERIKLQGFKSIREIPGSEDGTGKGGLELRDVSLLIGANGAGKSNFLSFFELLQAIVDRRLEIYVAKAGGASRLLHFGRKATERISGRIEFEGTEDGTAMWHEWKLVPSEGEHLVFESERQPEDALEFESELLYWQNPNSFTWGDVPGPPSVLDGGKPGSREAEGLFHDNSTANKLREYMTRMAPIQVSHFADMGPDSRARQYADLDDNRFLRPDGRNIAPFLFLLKTTKPSSYRRVVDAARLAFPYVEDFVLEPSRKNPRLIQLEWNETGTDDYRDAFYLSDGTLRFICLAALLLQPDPPGLILIDEPELGLHPFAIGVLAELLQAVARADSQVIVSTQSVTLVNQFAPEDLVIVERQKEEGSSKYETVFKSLKNREELNRWLDDYALGDLWERNFLGGSPTHA